MFLIWFSLFLTSTVGSSNPVGLIICSTICPEFLSSYSAGVALTKIVWLKYFSNSSNFNGLLSNAEGNLNPKSIKFHHYSISYIYLSGKFELLNNFGG